MRRSILTLLFLWLPMFSSAQSALNPQSTVAKGEFPAARYPHPFVFGGLTLNGGGYAPTAWVGGAGLNIELKHMVFEGTAAYDTGHKVNDNTINNHGGHDRKLAGNAFYRLNRFYLGGGASWAQLSTTNYTKQAWHPEFGAGHDWFWEDLSLRGQVLYLLPGSDRQNGGHGPEFSLWLPSPATDHRFFVRDTIGIFMVHDTITTPSDESLTALQVGNRSVTGFVNLALMYRF